MAGDIPISERLAIISESEDTFEALARPMETGRVLHMYGNRVRIEELGVGVELETPSSEILAEIETASREQLNEIESLGVAAFQMRLSSEYREAKRNRPRQGELWNFPEGGCTEVTTGGEAGSVVLGAAAAPTSAYLEGSVAVGIIIVEGPTTALQFDAAERTRVVAEVQNGLSFYAATNPMAGLTFVYDIQIVRLNLQPDQNATDLEALWRDPAMEQLGYPSSWASVSQYVEDLRREFRTRWTYCAFFTKYPVSHFAYASLGGPRLVMHYDNDGWGPDNIDRVFAHETGHIFMCPDEYAQSNCGCGGGYGRWQKPNTNCENCAPNGGISCIMKHNDWAMCMVTPAHLGWVSPRIYAKHSGKALDVAGGSKDNGARIIQYSYHGGDNQLFRPDPLENGYFRLVAQHSGKVLDVAGSSKENSARVIQYDWHGGNNQQFRFERLSDGCVRIVAKHSGKVLDVTGSSKEDGAQIVQHDWHGGDNQRWLLTAPITVKHSGKVLDVTGSSKENGAQIVQYDYHGGGNQIFRPEPLEDGYFRFVAQHSGKVLDVAGSSKENSARVIQYDWHGGDNQRFRLEQLGDGYVRIVAKHSGKVLDVFGGSGNPGARIIQYDWHGGDNQRWLVPRW